MYTLLSWFTPGPFKDSGDRNPSSLNPSLWIWIQTAILRDYHEGSVWISCVNSSGPVCRLFKGLYLISPPYGVSLQPGRRRIVGSSTHPLPGFRVEIFLIDEALFEGFDTLLRFHAVRRLSYFVTQRTKKPTNKRGSSGKGITQNCS